MPGTDMIVPMLTTGLDGGSSTKSAASMAASTPGAGRAWSAPVATIWLAGTAARSRTHHSWKCTERGPVPSSMTTWVSTRSSDIGSRITPGAQRSHSRRVASASVAPEFSIAVLVMCVAMSRSPRVNQSGPAP